MPIEIERKFLSKTARSQGQAIRYYRDPFRLVPVKNLADIADRFTRNEIMSSNEIRAVIGMKPADDPKADELINSNINHGEDGGIGGEDELNIFDTSQIDPSMMQSNDGGDEGGGSDFFDTSGM